MTEGRTYNSLFQRGVLLRQQRRFKEGCEFLGMAIAADPHQAPAYAELALCYNDWGGHGSQALDAIDKAISLMPNSAYFMGLKSWIYVCQEKYGRALNTANDAVEMDPLCITALNSQANAFTKLRKWKQAEESARRILALDANDIPALNLLAQALRLGGRAKESTEVVSRILALVPNNAFGHMNAGYGAMEVGDHIRANEHFLISLRMNPHNDLARKGLLHSLRSRVWIYRLHFRYLVFIRRPVTITRIGLFVAGLAMIGLGYFLLEGCHAGLGGAVVSGLWLAIIYLNFFSRITGNVFLCLDPVGWYALTAKERSIAILFALGLTTFLGGMLITRSWKFGVPIFLVVIIFAISMFFPRIQGFLQERRQANQDIVD